MLNIFVTFVLGLVLAWTPAQSSPQRPAFRTEVNYVELDVSVTDKTGGRVYGLTPADFEVLENGKPQVISAFTEVHVPLPPARVEGAPLRLPDASVASNAGQADSRVYVIVMDYGTLAAEGTPRVKRQVAQFITDFLGPNDLAAIVSLGRSSRATEFTANKARLLAALNVTAEFVGSPASLAADVTPVPSGTASGSKFDDESADTIAAFTAMESDAQNTQTVDRLRVLGRVATFLKGMQGRRKSVIYVSQGIDAAPATADPGTSGLGQNAVAGTVTWLTQLLQASGVTVYSIDPRGMGAVDAFDGGGSATPLSNKYGPAHLGPIAFLRGLADDTGGISAVGFGDLTGPYRRIVEDNSSYYVLGYASDQKLDGKSHAIRVRVRGREVDARTRDHIEATKPSARPDAGEVALSSAWRGSDIRSLLARPLPAGDLGLSLRATASAIGTRGGDAIVQLAVEVDGAGFTFAPLAAAFADDIEVAFQAFDIKQELKASRTESTTLRLRAETRDAVAAHGWRYVTEFTVPPGLYQLRVAAAELNGHRAGSVFLDVPVADVAKTPLAVTGIALTAQSARLVPTAGTTPTVRAVSQAPITASRVFSLTDTLTVLAGIVDTTVGDRAVTSSAQLRAMDGTIVMDVAETVKADGLRAGSPPRAFMLSLKLVPPGDYDVVVRAVDGTKTATRTVPITVVR